MCIRDRPFTVPEVTVMMVVDTDGNADGDPGGDTKRDPDGDTKKKAMFVLVHKFAGFALSGKLEGKGYALLSKSGIWASVPGYPSQKKDLKPFFDHIIATAKRELVVESEPDVSEPDTDEPKETP